MKIKARTNWEMVCTLSLELCNGIEIAGTPRAGCVYMATDSLGGRIAHVERLPVDEIGPSHDGVWKGYEEEGSDLFRWTSATSGAEIEARRSGDEWSLTFSGPGSFYLFHFSRAVEASSIEVVDTAHANDVLNTLSHRNDEKEPHAAALAAIISLELSESRADARV